MSQNPNHIIAGPVDVYVAPVGESFPAIGATPAGNWTLIGTNGSDTDYTEDGVTVSHPETVEDFYSLGSTGPVKAFRTQEQMEISFELKDISADEYARVFNFGTKATDTDDYTVDIYRGLEVAYRALLIRGAGLSPAGNAYNLQYEVPRVRQNSTPEVVYVKGEPAGLSLSFMAMIDLSAASESEKFGRLRYQFQN